MSRDYIFTEGTGPYSVKYDDVDGMGPYTLATSEEADATARQRHLVRLSDGTLYAVYPKWLAGASQIYVKKSVDGGETWSEETRISTAAGMDGYDQYHPCIAVDSSDYLHVTWDGCATGYTVYSQIWYAKYSGSWQAPVRVSTGDGMDSKNQGYSSIATDSLDDLHVVWSGGATGYADHRPQIWYINNTAGWSVPLRLSTATGSFQDMGDFGQRNPSIAVDSGDNLHVVFNGECGHPTISEQIWYAKYDGSWSVPINISSPGVGPSHQLASIAIDSNDYIHVVWENPVANAQIWYAVYIVAWSAELRISTYAGMDSTPQNYPSIAIDSDDYLHVLWHGKATGYLDENKVWYAKYTAGWAAPEVLQPTGRNMYPTLRWSRWPSEVIPGFAELYGHVIIQNSSSKDLYAKVNIVHGIDLKAVATIRQTATPLNLSAIFWVRHPYWLWTNRRYLNGVIQLDETLLGNAILEYVIEGVMQDIKCQLIDNDLDYSGWDDIVDTPKLIRRATTYGVVAALYARKARTFSSRVIPVMAPVTVTVMGDDERAMNHWVDKMNNALELYISAQGGLLMDSSTADEEPVFSMEDIPPLLTDYTPWYEWLMKTRGSSS